MDTNKANCMKKSKYVYSSNSTFVDNIFKESSTLYGAYINKFMYIIMYDSFVFVKKFRTSR